MLLIACTGEDDFVVFLHTKEGGKYSTGRRAETSLRLRRVPYSKAIFLCFSCPLSCLSSKSVSKRFDNDMRALLRSRKAGLGRCSAFTLTNDRSLHHRWYSVEKLFQSATTNDLEGIKSAIDEGTDPNSAQQVLQPSFIIPRRYLICFSQGWSEWPLL